MANRLILELQKPHPLAGSHPFDRFPVQIGRDPDGDLVLDSKGDQSTSWHHVRIEAQAAGYLIHDCDTTNGTLVNGRAITATALHDGDRIQLGTSGPVLRVVLGASHASLFDQTLKVSLNLQAVPRIVLSVEGGTRAWPAGAQEFSQPVITLGRDAGNDVAFANPPHPVVSRHHAEIVLRGGHFNVVDKDATNGTFVNQQRVISVALRDGDRLMLGHGGPILNIHLPHDAPRPRFARKSLWSVAILSLLLVTSIGGSYYWKAVRDDRPPPAPESSSEAQFIESRVRDFAKAMHDDIKHVPYSMVRQIQQHTTELARQERVTLSRQLARAQTLLPEVERILRSHGLPQQLAYIAFQESRFDPAARSRAGAAGLWQLMAATGREFGLRIDSEVDERLDALKSTHAAARYLKKLYLLYGDFMLTLAAYNYGPSNVNLALTRLVADEPLKNRNYWYLVKQDLLPKETDEYVYKVIAGWIVATHPERFGLVPPSEASTTGFS